jgi:RimJ/RimL family protein N-acetyltransferase
MPDLSTWAGCDAPRLQAVAGRWVDVAALDVPADAAGLFDALCGPENDDLWRYIPIGPFADLLTFTSALGKAQAGWNTCVFRAPGSGQVLGMASYMRMRPEQGSAEVGCVVFSKALQKTAAATEAMYLMAAHLFDDLGYRRYEWKCNNNNDASKAAAARFGFVFEGVFRQDMVVKGENRDTAWFSMTDGEWPLVKAAFEAWLAPGNFDGQGQQVEGLVEVRQRLAASSAAR